MKLHLVHADSTGTLAVVGFFFQISGSENTALSSLITGINALSTGAISKLTETITERTSK
jgi:carbonic anhydrase